MSRPRIRTLKPGNWADEEVGRVSRDARLLRDVLVTYADDDGRWRNLPSAIIGFGYPYDEDVSPAKLKKWQGELVAAGLIHLYEVDGVPYGCFPTWHLHQQINKYMPSDLPEPGIGWVTRGEKSRKAPVEVPENDGTSPTLSRASLSLSPSVVEEPEGKNPPSPREVVEEPQAVVARAQARVTTGSEDVVAVFDAWVQATERDASRTQLTPDRRRRIAKALASHGLDDCLAAVRNIGADAWARGENDRGQRYDDIEHALGKTERIERWRDRRAPARAMSDRERMQRELLEHAGVSL